MPLEGESYWTFVWTLGWGRPFEGESYLVFVWTWGGAPGLWIDGSVGSVGSVGSIDPSSDQPIDLSIDLPI